MLYVPHDDATSSYTHSAQWYAYDSLNRLKLAREAKDGVNSFVEEYTAGGPALQD